MKAQIIGSSQIKQIYSPHYVGFKKDGRRLYRIVDMAFGGEINYDVYMIVGYDVFDVSAGYIQLIRLYAVFSKPYLLFGNFKLRGVRFRIKNYVIILRPYFLPSLYGVKAYKA